MSSSHYRALSVTGLTDPPASFSRSSTDAGPTRRPSVTYSKRASTQHADRPDAGLLLHDPSARARLAGVPRNYRRLRLAAYLGWALAGVLVVALAASHGTVPSELRDLRPLAGVRDAAARVGAAAAGRAARPPTGAGAQSGHASAAAAAAATASGETSPVTIVSSFYRVDSGKKHRVSEYNEWLGNFLHSVELPIVFYCAPSFAAYVKNLRGNKPITLITEFSSPFDMPPVQDLGGHDWAVRQHKLDPEQHVHVPDVYGVWTAKPWIVKDAAARNPYGSEYFFWVDAGGFRDSSVTHSFVELPTVLSDLYSTLPADTVMLAATLGPFEGGTSWVKDVKRNDEMDRTDRLQGGWFGGKKEAVNMWERETRKVTVLQSAMGRFAAKEQPVWTMAARLNWHKIYVQNMAYRSGPDCGPDMWFAFEYFADGRDCEIPAWSGPEYARLEDDERKAARAGQHMEGGLVGGGDEVGWEGIVGR
ncbi:uncharacterized protein RHOBADRAFT_42248 [Rhodotorula graminis WP1]|uniref:Uncharacterized protein n=1 Tax=Rhodotorula graminis (strain WP1) TaxID=578459 RepID=A0A194S991_RHOGW|nr:uncharacterized protein RHOBADRAFT_42248 [Rhodotorula graminis WP1]KPV77035.1 hypothetical protein RHOBADRAFT_42248 [Rhodotorula graminis WP1]